MFKGHFRDGSRNRFGGRQPTRAGGVPALLMGWVEACKGTGWGLVVVEISKTMTQASDSEHSCLGSTQKWGMDFRGTSRPETDAESTLAKGQKCPPWSTSKETWRGQGDMAGQERGNQGREREQLVGVSCGCDEKWSQLSGLKPRRWVALQF